MSQPTDSPLAGGRRPRLLYLTWRDAGHPEAGGAEVFFERTAEVLHRAGWDVDVLTARYPGAIAQEETRGGVHRRRGRRYSVYVWAAMHLLRHPRRYDAIIDVQNGVPFFARVFSRSPVLLVVHHVHRDQWKTFFGPTVARIGWWLESSVSVRVHRSTQYVTVSGASRDALIELGVEPTRVSVAYSGMDLQVVVANPACKHADPTLVVLGRLVPHKRVEIAIDTLAALLGRHPSLRLVVIGDGYWLPHLRRHCADAGVSDRVTFTGYVDEVTKQQLLAEAWVNLLPSTMEGWGLAIVEAGLHQTPSVAFRSAGGTAESIHDGETGLLVDDVSGFVEATDRLLTDDEFRAKLGSAAENFARTMSWESTGEELLRVVASVSGRQPRSTQPAS